MDPNLSNGGNPSRGSPINGKIMLSAIVILFAIVVFILFLHLYVRWQVLRRATRRFRRRRRLILAGESQLPATSSNRRLDPSILKSLPVLLFSNSDGGELVECAVCLNEFDEGEKIRCLPRCGHGFHIDCIDMWFCSHSTCPLCRAEVEAVEAPRPNLIPADDPPVMPAREDLCSTCRREDDTGSSSSDTGGCEVRIQVPPVNSLGGGGSGSGGQEEQPSLGFETGEQQALKLASSRILLIWWLLMRRIHRGGALVSDPDLESGDVAFRPLPPPAPASTR